MADAGFYRGTSSEQDSRFTDKERKLLKQMRFDGALDQKICMERVNLDVVKPWITAKLNEILGIEDDVVIEYVFSQLEEKTINPKVMQINLTGFLNARRAREFMGELWSILLEAQNSEDGIPASFVEKKMKELQEKAKNKTPSSSNGAAAEAAGSDWKDRYESLTGGRYGPKDASGDRKSDDRRQERRGTDGSREYDKDREVRDRDRRERDRDGRKSDRDRDSKYGRRGDGDRESSRGRERDAKDDAKERDRRNAKDEKISRRSSRSEKNRSSLSDGGRKKQRSRSRSRTPKKSPPRRRFTEKKEDRNERSTEKHKRRKRESSSYSEDDEEEERHRKKKSRNHSDYESNHGEKKWRKHRHKRHGDSDAERSERKHKKHKKEKKHKKKRSSSGSE